MTIKIIIGRRIRCRHKCHSWRTKTSISTAGRPQAPVATTGRDRDRTHFSKCNNNQPSSGGRISLRGSGSLIIKHIIQWTSRTRPTHPSPPTHHHQTQEQVVDRHHPRKKISTLVIMQIRCAPLAPWAPRTTVSSAVHPAESSFYHRCRAETARRHLMCIGRDS